MSNKFVEAIGSIDGINRDFETSTPYVAGTLNAFRNGCLVTKVLDDGFDEIDPNAGTFRMKVAPELDDTLFCFYGEA